MQEAIELSSGQEEADTRLLLHAKLAATLHVKAVAISSEDADERILCISFAHESQFLFIRDVFRNTKPGMLTSLG